MPKRMLPFLMLTLIVLSVFPVANLSAGEPGASYAADISRPVVEYLSWQNFAAPRQHLKSGFGKVARFVIE